jgi:hypothetical protein
MDDLVKEVVPVVDVHKVVEVEVVVQVIDYQFVLLVANVVDDEDEDDDDVIDNRLVQVDNYYYCFLYVQFYHRNYLNDVFDNVYLNVVWMTDVDLGYVVCVKMMRMMLKMIGNENVSENEIGNGFENVSVNENEFESENGIMND